MKIASQNRWKTDGNRVPIKGAKALQFVSVSSSEARPSGLVKVIRKQPKKSSKKERKAVDETKRSAKVSDPLQNGENR
jgi:hypothetical protein